MENKANVLEHFLMTLAAKWPRVKAAETLVEVWTVTHSWQPKVGVDRAAGDTAWNLPPHPRPGCQPKLSISDTRRCAGPGNA